MNGPLGAHDIRIINIPSLTVAVVSTSSDRLNRLTSSLFLYSGQGAEPGCVCFNYKVVQAELAVIND